MLSQSGVIETRGDAGALFLIRVPALPDRRKGGLTDKVSGKLAEAVLLREGKRFLEAARMRAAEASEIFFDEPLGRLLAEDRHKEEIEELERTRGRSPKRAPRTIRLGGKRKMARTLDASRSA